MVPFDVPDSLLRLLEAFVFASPEPVTLKTVEPLIPRDLDPWLVLQALERRCAGRCVILVQTGEGWSFCTAPDLAGPLREALTETRRLPRVAMETLVVIALHQPVTRAEIEQIRGLSLGQATMDLLLEAGLIQPWGRREAPGRPSLWVTTPRFLTQFGLQSLRDLPGAERVRPRGDGGENPPPAARAGPPDAAAAPGPALRA
jgi:segregation and condensation protein B